MKKNQQSSIISSDNITTNSYNTTEEEDEQNKQDSFYKIQMRKEKMKKFFIENPYLSEQLDLNKEPEDNMTDFKEKKDKKQAPIIKKEFNEDMRLFNNNNNNQMDINNNEKYWDIITKEVNENYNNKKRNKPQTLDQIMKRINIFKSRLDNLDRNPILKKILEKESEEDSEDKEILEEKKRKENEIKNKEFQFLSFKKRMQNEYQLKNKLKEKKLKEKNYRNSVDINEKKEINKKKNVFSRLMNKKKDNDSDKSINNLNDSLNIKYEVGKKLYKELSKANNEKEFKKIAREHWKSFKKNYDDNLKKLKQQQFVHKFSKENKKYNIYLPDFSIDKNKILDIDEENLRNQDLLGNDEEIFTMIDKIMNGNVFKRWKNLQDKDL